MLANSSVWVAHFRKSNGLLQSLLATDQVLCHLLILLELACGTPPAPRERTLGDLKKLQQSVVATTEKTLELVEREQLQDLGCGAVDMSQLEEKISIPIRSSPAVCLICRIPPEISPAPR